MRLSLKLNRSYTAISRWMVIVLFLLPSLMVLRQARVIHNAICDATVPFRGSTPREEEVHSHSSVPTAMVRRCLKRIPRNAETWIDLALQSDSREADQSALWLRARNSVPIPTGPTVSPRVLRGPPCA